MEKSIAAVIEETLQNGPNTEQRRHNLSTCIKLAYNNEAYIDLYKAISTATPDLCDEIIKCIIIYLCYHQFYFKKQCAFNRKTGTIVFELFDINCRLCYILTSHVINYDIMNNNIDPENTNGIITMDLECTPHSSAMHIDSEFVAQYQNHYFVLKWKYTRRPLVLQCESVSGPHADDRLNPEHHPLYGCKMQNVYKISNSFFIKTQSLKEKNRPYLMQLDSLEHNPSPSIRLFRVNGFFRGRTKLNFHQKEEIHHLFRSNNLINSRMRAMESAVYILRVDVRLKQSGNINCIEYIVDISSLSSNRVSLSSIAKFVLFEEQDFPWTFSIYYLKIVPAYFIHSDIDYAVLLAVYAGDNGESVCIGYFDLRQYNEMGEFIPVKMNSVKLCDSKRIIMRTFGDIVLNNENKTIHIKLICDNYVCHWILDENLKIMDDWKMNGEMSDNFTECYCEYPVNRMNIINKWDQKSNFVIIKENDIGLQQSIHKKTLYMYVKYGTGILIVSGVVGYTIKSIFFK